MKLISRYFLIKPEDLAWRPSNLMKIPNTEYLERTGSGNLGARLWRLPSRNANTLQKRIGTDMNPDAGDFAEAQKSSVAPGRFGQPGEIAVGVEFLANSVASYVTGSVLISTAVLARDRLEEIYCDSQVNASMRNEI